MMFPRIRLALVLTCAVVVPVIIAQRASALDRYWQGDVSNVYGGSLGNNGNWDALSCPVCTPAQIAALTSPRASQLERAVIGTDNPAGALNSNLAPFGSPVIGANVASPGGIALGIREFDYDNAVFPNPVPDAGTLIGKLTITGGNPTSASTAAAAFGADGRVQVGVHGRGYLTMTGGVLTAPTLIVGGENITTNAGTPQELGPSTVDLSGNASLQITGGSTGIANFDRRLKVTGPTVNFNASGRIRFVNTSLFTAGITSATTHSALNTGGNALLSGAVAVEFSGAAATRDPITSLGETWTLIRSTLSNNAIAGDFTNLGSGGVIQPTGLDAAHSAPLGANYRVKKVAVGSTSELQLSYEQTLVLTVNRDTGQTSIRNPLAGHIAIDSYSINSARGSLLASYNGLGAATPNAGVWVKPTAPGGNTVNALSEVKEPDNTVPIGNQDAYDLFPVPTVSLGTGFSRTAVGAGGANFGLDGEDLIFEFSGPATGGILRGQVEYTGTKFENDLVLRVNPNTGQAFLKNDTLVSRTIDGFSILSSTGNLSGGGFTGLGGSWQTSSPPTANAISQTNLTGSTTIAANAQLSIGDISATGFLDDAAKNGLSLEFAIATGGVAAGDYNSNGVVDAADYTTWRNNLGAAIALTNQNPAAATPALVDQEDYDFWKANFGNIGGGETTFRVGSVVFDVTAGSGGGGLAGAAVPEPSACWLMLIGLGAVGLVRRKHERHTEQKPFRAAEGKGTLGANGAITMSNRIRMLVTEMVGVSAVLLTSLQAAAVTQGIPLTNGDFSLPGPIGTKVLAFDDAGAPIPGIIPGWTFTGGSGNAAFGEPNAGLGNSLFGDGLPGDSGTEGGGNPGNELILSTLDGKVFQTSSFNAVSIPANQKYRFSFDVHNIFTPVGVGQLTARLYYIDGGGLRQTIGSPLVTGALAGFQNLAIEFRSDVPADVAALTPAIGRPIGVEFDTTSFESDVTPGHLESWAGVDNVLLQITGLQRGDFNGDGAITNADYVILRDNLQEAHTYEFEGELTGDYFVDLDDFRAFKTIFAALGSGSLEGSNVPEPSTLLLVLLGAAGIVGSTIRKRFTMPNRLSLLLVAAVALGATLASVTSASAELLVYDPFDVGSTPAIGQYASFTPPITAENPLVRILGQNPTIGPTPLMTGAWTDTAGNTPTQFVQSSSLVYRGIAGQGGSVTTWFDSVSAVPPAGSGAGRVGRYFGNLPGASSPGFISTTIGTYYLSFMASYGTVVNPNAIDDGNLGFRTTEFWPEGGTVGIDNGRSEIGYQGFAGDAEQRLASSAQLRFVTPGGGTQFLTDTTFNEDNNNTHLIVMKFVLSDVPASDNIFVYLDPIDAIEPIVPSASASNVDFTLSAISTISVFGNATGTRPVFDELRVGTEYIDALPEFPLPGDTNLDDKVDLLDYQAIISHMNLLGQPLANGDVTGDGKVTIADYRYWKDRYPTPPGAGSASGIGVPEPSSLLLMFAGVVLAASAVRV